MEYEIGDTPLKLVNFLSNQNTKIWAKFEYLNPTGSHKDRAYLSMIDDLESKNKLKKLRKKHFRHFWKWIKLHKNRHFNNADLSR